MEHNIIFLFLGLNTSASTTEVKSSQSISTVISLLTTLCRGSKSVSYVCYKLLKYTLTLIDVF